MKRTFQELTIKDPFMFAAVMSDETQCKRLLSLVLEMEILQVSVVPEKTITYHPEYRGVRLDVMAIENGTNRRFDIEMQIQNHKNIPKRSRYYHAQLDMDALLTGTDYNKLPDTYVIFICDYDPLSSQFYKYTFSNCCKENNEAIPDGNYTIWLSTKGQNEQDVPKELVEFLKYVESPDKADTSTDDSFINSLKEQIAAIKRNREWEGKFMLFEEMLQDEKEEGRAEGRSETKHAMAQLIQILSTQNRMNDILKIANDSDYLDKLLKEFNL